MHPFSSSHKTEAVVLTFLLIFLGVNAFFNATFGFSLPLYLGTVPLSALLAFFFPRAGFMAALLVTLVFERFFTLQPLIIGDIAYKLYPLDVILVACFLSCVLLFLQKGRTFFRFRGIDTWLLFFFLFVSGLFALALFDTTVSLSVAFSTWKHYVFYGWIVWLVAGMLRTRADLVAFLRLFFWGLGIVSIFLVIGIMRGEGLWTEFTPLSTAGTRFLAFPHAFYFSLGLLIILLALPLWWNQVKRRQSWLVLAGSVVLGLGVLGSLMRHLWLGISGTVAMALLVSPFLFGKALLRYSVRFIFPVVMFVTLSTLWVFLAPESQVAGLLGHGMAVVKERVFSIGNQNDESLAWRGAVWSSTLQRFQEHPWFGIGFGVSVPVEMGGYRQYIEVRNMHNSWLALLIQTGVAGTVLFFGFLGSLFLALFRLAHLDAFLSQVRFVLVGLLFFQGLVFFSQPYLETNLLGLFFWTTLGLARAMIEFSSQEKAA
ncbi:MAG: O-antigen ligase family protein [Candidatus Moranbacteria bacterium]|nr:O-antigen ligase family protein [Candidatus Moranbacteria bacterium]